MKDFLKREAKRNPKCSHCSGLCECTSRVIFFYDIKRFDIKGKEYLRTLGKYYIVDIGLRNYLLGFRDRDSGHAIENIVYFELIRRGYDVSIGKVGNFEVDLLQQRQTTNFMFRSQNQ